MKSKIISFIIASTVIGVAVCYFILGWDAQIIELSKGLDSLIKSVYAIAIAIFINKIIAFFISIAHFNGRRSKTISTMIMSLVNYTTAIITLIVIMALFLGQAYMTELFAGLGVCAVVIGFGCQALISDIVAGIFTVFEGNYQVGDIIVLHGWRGTVVSIGLRTTVIEDAGGNKKIVNNSSISEVINNSQADSVTSIIMGIEYDQSLLAVEEVIYANIEDIKKRIPQIIDGPNYLGVDELAASSVNLRIMAKCAEQDLLLVQRALNREFKLLFDENNINIPFPQITLSNKQ